jgi:hypothetical protein
VIGVALLKHHGSTDSFSRQEEESVVMEEWTQSERFISLELI